MSWGHSGGGWQGMRPSFDNPMSWSLPVLRAAAIDVRVHVLFIIFVLVWLGQGVLTSSPRDIVLVCLDIAVLFVIVLLHEFGHCFGCRATGGSADEILMWPLGGLAYCAPPHRWTAHLVTVLAGPAVNLVVFLVLCPLLGVLTGDWLGIAIPNPFQLSPLGPLLRDGSQPWWLLVLYTTHLISFLLLLFNLLPVFPLDGGRIVQALLWPRFGFVRSMRYAVYTGYVGAIALGILGAVMKDVLLFGIAIFGGAMCYRVLKQLEFAQAELGAEDEYGLFSGPSRAEVSAATREARRQAKADEAAERERSEVDRILAKIADTGLDSLSSRERRTLRQATDRSRDA